MTRPDPRIAVMFRTYPNNGEVIALMPYEPSDVAGRYITCYVHHGQHGHADYQAVIRQTRPATLKEYWPLLTELFSLGYDLREIKRRGRRAHHKEQ